jgi:hypothetical protein
MKKIRLQEERHRHRGIELERALELRGRIAAEADVLPDGVVVGARRLAARGAEREP